MEATVATHTPKFTYALVGEAFGAEEELESKRQGKPVPFIGAAGQILNSALSAAGIKRSDCFITNVFNLRPPQNKLKSIMVPKTKGASGWPPLRQGQYLDPNLVFHLERLYKELRECQPKIIICLGATAQWALSGSGALGPHRGHLHFWESIPMIPTYHPARILRSYFLKMSLIGDLNKARQYVAGDLKESELNFIEKPDMKDIREFFAFARNYGICSVDIETLPAYRHITCIGFGTPMRSICVPFFHPEYPGYNYWPTKELELEALFLCKDFIQDHTVKKIFHHAVYDVPWLADVLGIETRGETADTRIMHANIAAELPHDLSNVTATWFLYPPWKALHKSAKAEDSNADTGEE